MIGCLVNVARLVTGRKTTGSHVPHENPRNRHRNFARAEEGFWVSISIHAVWEPIEMVSSAQPANLFFLFCRDRKTGRLDHFFFFFLVSVVVFNLYREPFNKAAIRMTGLFEAGALRPVHVLHVNIHRGLFNFKE